MDYKSYIAKSFINPAPEPRYNFSGVFGVSLYYENYDAVIKYYEQVLGPPAYIEGDGTRGWRIGAGWLTLFQSEEGNPSNVGVTFVVETPAEAEALQRAFIEAGGAGPDPSDELMYEPVRFCLVNDPFGTEILIVSPLEKGS